MSQDDPTPPEVSVPLPDPVPTPRSASGWLRLTSIRLLRGTINALEQTVEQLEEPDRLPAGPEHLPLRVRWTKLLRRVRLRLHVRWNRALGDRALSGLLILAFLFPIWLTANLFIQPANPTSAPPANQPAIPKPAPAPDPFTAARPAPQPFPPERTPPTAAGPSLVPPLPAKAQADRLPYGPPLPRPKAQADRLPYGPPLPPPRAITPPPSPTASPAPIPNPQPPTPNAPSLTTTLQTQLAQVADEYAVGLIQAIQPNFKQSRLVIQMQEGWVKLERSQQDELANALWQNAQDLNFSKLELTNAQHQQLARSPVVGNEMIMLKR